MKIFIQKRGSIALISLLIISTFTLLIVLAASGASISTYEKYLNESSGEMTYYGAESCLEDAIIRLESDSDFTGGTLTIDDDITCTTTVIGTTEKTISISVDFLDYTQNYEAVVRFIQNGSIYNSELISWQET